jgi:hypothetical protein
VEGIEIGECYVFPKIDGTNASVWLDRHGIIQAGSRNRHLTINSDNAGFYDWAVRQASLSEYLKANPSHRLYGEWLVPHALRTYRDDAWKNFYVFDVMDGDKYLHYGEYSKLLEKYGIEYIPPICVIKNPTQERLFAQLEKNGYLIKDGSGVGEGIVVKNYDYKNKYGRVTWAKIVTNEFKAKHSKTQVTEIKETTTIEQRICEKYVTKSLIEKELSKIESENDGWSSKLIPRLIGTIYYCLVSEECWNFVREFKNPTVDFKKLQQLCTLRIKELMPNIF